MICFKSPLYFLSSFLQGLSALCYTAKDSLKTARPVINLDSLRHYLHLHKENLLKELSFSGFEILIFMKI